jgi:cupin fold WbuC family metalloprotein
MIDLQRINDETFVALDRIVRFGADEIAFVKRQARASPRKRARICAHKSLEDTLHEMLIAICADSYIQPHRHVGKSESFHIVEGEVDVVVLDEAGEVADVIELGSPASGRQFFYRLSESAFHTLLIRSEVLVIHEVTNGPFVKANTTLAPFAPPENESSLAQSYMQRVSEMASRFGQS